MRHGVFARAPLLLADVGASGGIADQWRLFEPDLRAVGFDPLVTECERLNREESNPAIRYYDYFVVARGLRRVIPSGSGERPPGRLEQPAVRTYQRCRRAKTDGAILYTVAQLRKPGRPLYQSAHIPRRILPGLP